MELTQALDALPTTCLLAIKNGKTVYEYGDPTEVSYLASVRKSILSLLYGRRSPTASSPCTAPWQTSASTTSRACCRASAEPPSRTC